MRHLRIVTRCNASSGPAVPGRGATTAELRRNGCCAARPALLGWRNNSMPATCCLAAPPQQPAPAAARLGHPDRRRRAGGWPTGAEVAGRASCPGQRPPRTATGSPETTGGPENSHGRRGPPHHPGGPEHRAVSHHSTDNRLMRRIGHSRISGCVGRPGDRADLGRCARPLSLWRRYRKRSWGEENCTRSASSRRRFRRCFGRRPADRRSAVAILSGPGQLITNWTTLVLQGHHRHHARAGRVPVAS
jgi:hypothetical protein